MNRNDLLKKCVDKGVADEASIEAVSHLFYVYILTALQKGQRVEVPDFGTFGARLVGVKRVRKMPFFEPEKELAEQVNERYKNLKYLVLGRFDLTPVNGDEEYTGKEPPHDSLVDQVGREVVVETHRDVTIEEYERSLALRQTQQKEKTTMPKLNLKGEGLEEETKPFEHERESRQPLLHEEEGGRGPSAFVQILIAVLLLGGITFALNHFGVVHLWGPKKAAVTETLPEPELSIPTEVPIDPGVEATPTPTIPPSGVKPPPVSIKEPPVKPSLPASSTSGEFSVQVSSWMTPTKASEEVDRLKGGGLDAFVTEATVAGEKWYRVRVGRYATQRDAEVAAAQLQQMLENGIWVARLSSQ